LFAAVLVLGLLSAVLLKQRPSAKPAISTGQYIEKQALQKSAVTPAAGSASMAGQSIPVVGAQQLFLNQRLEATKRLLLNAKAETILLQIKSVPSALPATNLAQDALLIKELAMLGQRLEMDNIYLYRMKQGGGVYTVILYGAYQQRADALKALRELPLEMKSNQPYLRTLAGVKKEIEATAAN
jgi:hypothetical protein